MEAGQRTLNGKGVDVVVLAALDFFLDPSMPSAWWDSLANESAVEPNAGDFETTHSIKSARWEYWHSDLRLTHAKHLGKVR